LETWNSLAFTGALDARELETNCRLIITILFVFLARPPLRTSDHIQVIKDLRSGSKVLNLATFFDPAHRSNESGVTKLSSLERRPLAERFTGLSIRKEGASAATKIASF